MNEALVGMVELNYRVDGTPMDATFQPQMKVEMDADLKKQLMSYRGSSDEILNQAQLMFGAYLSKLDDITMLDRAEYQVRSEMVECIKYTNGNPRRCLINIMLRKVNTSTNKE